MAGARALGWETMSVPLADGPGLKALLRERRPDAAITSGTRADSAAARERCRAAGVPVMILDLGYFLRATGPGDTAGHNQLGWETIG